MKQHPAIQLRIPAPCNESWEQMSVVERGRHCNKCATIITDFSAFSDEELLAYLKENPNIHCGRFHQSQLNRTISSVSVKRKKLLRFNKIAAGLFALLSLKDSSTKAGVKTNPVTAAPGTTPSQKALGGTGKVVISGFVTDAEGTPVERAAISFDSAVVAHTDEEGKFSFELDNISAKPHTVYFNHGDFVTTVRSYYGTMLSTTYNVTLYKPAQQGFTMGVMITRLQSEELPSITFHQKETTISSSNQALLSVVAEKLRSNPDASIIIKAYPGGHLPRQLFLRRLTNVKNYLTRNGYISADRISTQLSETAGDINVIDLQADEN